MEYRVLRSRRKSLAIEITPQGEVLVRAPARMPEDRIQRFLECRRDWINAHLKNCFPCKPLPPETHQALIQSAKHFFPERVRFFSERMGVTCCRITIRSQKTRWGSCSAAGNLNFNCLLMLAPPEVRDYVIVHELCHRKVMDHSPRFWKEVEAVFPDFQLCRRWLKETVLR